MEDRREAWPLHGFDRPSPQASPPGPFNVNAGPLFPSFRGINVLSVPVPAEADANSDSSGKGGLDDFEAVLARSRAQKRPPPLQLSMKKFNSINNHPSCEPAMRDLTNGNATAEPVLPPTDPFVTPSPPAKAGSLFQSAAIEFNTIRHAASIPESTCEDGRDWQLELDVLRQEKERILRAKRPVVSRERAIDHTRDINRMRLSDGVDDGPSKDEAIDALLDAFSDDEGDLSAAAVPPLSPSRLSQLDPASQRALSTPSPSPPCPPSPSQSVRTPTQAPVTPSAPREPLSKFRTPTTRRSVVHTPLRAQNPQNSTPRRPVAALTPNKRPREELVLSASPATSLHQQSPRVHATASRSLASPAAPSSVPLSQQTKKRAPWTPAPTGPRISLRDLARTHGMFHDAASVLAYNIPLEVVEMTSVSAAQFKFVCDGEELGCAEVHAMLAADGASLPTFTPAWTENAWRWIVWKLAALERRFPAVFAAQRLLTVQEVVAQLRARYDRELVHARHPPLRRLLERNAPAEWHVVLLIAAVESSAGEHAVVELSDGWYGVRAELDAALTQLLRTGRVAVGHKLRALGVELIGAAQSDAIDIAEAAASSAPLLRLRYNRVLPARWDARLGVQRVQSVPRALHTLRSAGGSVQTLELAVVALYPLVHVETRRYDRTRTRLLVPRDLHAEEQRLARIADRGDGDEDDDEDDDDDEEGTLAGDGDAADGERECVERIVRSEAGEARVAAVHAERLERLCSAQYARLESSAGTDERARERLAARVQRVAERCARRFEPLLELLCADVRGHRCVLRVYGERAVDMRASLRVGQRLRVFHTLPARASHLRPHALSAAAAPQEVRLLYLSARSTVQLLDSAALDAPAAAPVVDFAQLPLLGQAPVECACVGALLASAARADASIREGACEQRLFLADASGALLCVTVRRHADDYPLSLAEHARHYAPPLPVALRHVTYTGYDARAAVHTAEALVHCELQVGRLDAATSPHWQRALAAHTATEAMRSAAERVRRLMGE